MAATEYGVNHPLAVKLWSKKLLREALKETYIDRFTGDSADSLIYVKNELSKEAGDRIRVGLRVVLSGAGVEGDDTLEGNQEALTTYTDDLLINQLRHGVLSKGKMSEQRVAFSVREEAMAGLRDWFADRADTAFFNQIAGNTAQADTKYTGHNATVAASTGRVVFGPIDTTEASLSSASVSANFQLTMIDKAITIAKTASPLVRPIRVNGQPKYVAFLHPYQVYSLRTDATANRITWYDTQKALVSGGDKNNGIFSGALGEYNGVVIHESTRVPLAPSTTTVRRGIFCGAQAACMAFGRDGGRPTSMSWHEETADLGNQLSVSAGMIWGIKKSVFNSADFGTVLLSSHAEAP